MSTLLRFDPFRELDRIFEQASDQYRRATIPMDAYKHGDTFVIQFDLPGVDPSSINLEVERNMFTVEADRSWNPVEGDDVVASERRHGQFRRQLIVGESLDADNMHASYEHGVLTVTIPIAEKSKARKISVQGANSAPEAIEARSE